MPISFEQIFATAVLHKGSKKAVTSQLPDVLTPTQLKRRKDVELLSLMSRRIFRAGLKHSVIDAKWPEFEKAFKQFNPIYCAHMSDDDIAEHMRNTALIRHLGKIKSIRTNATMVLHRAEQYSSFARFIAEWPSDNIVALWTDLKKQGAQLGGMSGARFLRMAGKDTFLLTDDVTAVLKFHGYISKPATSQRDLAVVQAVFNEWHAESGLPYSHISRIVSMTSNL